MPALGLYDVHGQNFAIDTAFGEDMGDATDDVCQSAMSWGPDFVSVVEGLYCAICEPYAVELMRRVWGYPKF